MDGSNTTTSTQANSTTDDGRIGETATLEATLPADLRQALGAFVGTGSVGTLGELVEEVRAFSGGPLSAEQLCHAGGGTDHWGEVDGERYHFQCFYDAVVLAAIEDRPVDVHTVSPGGSVVEARAVGTERLSVTPAEAVFSLGIEDDPGTRSGGDPTDDDAYAAICPYVKAFPDREAYGQWAESVPAATVAMPLNGATELARALAD